ncbi:MAG: CdvA-like protein [Candidatus Bathyarchaeia archaeon]|nr:CdvA-like protein [Candidatus Bathyarchaeota archaeon]
MTSTIYSSLIGKQLKDENGREIGKIISFIIDSSGTVREALVEGKSETLVRYPVSRLKFTQDDVFLVFDIERRVEEICEKMPLLLKKRDTLETLFKNKEIPPEIYEGLSAEIDKSISELETESQNLLKEIDSEVQRQEDSIKMLYLARTFLEMEHAIGNVKDDIFRQSLISILREIKYTSHRKSSLLKTKERLLGLTPQRDIGSEINLGQKSAISVRITEK